MSCRVATFASTQKTPLCKGSKRHVAKRSKLASKLCRGTVQFGSGGDFFLNRGKCEELRAIVCGTGRIVLLLTSPVGCESLRASAPEANLDCETKMSCHVATFA